MEQDDRTVVRLNLGCGFLPKIGFINVDAFEICKPDVVHDLNVFPYPWDDNSVDLIELWHVLEHLEDWWAVFRECTRILKVGGVLDIHVPDESSTTAGTYRDHLHIFSQVSFHGILDRTGFGTNAWAAMEDETVPMRQIKYKQAPFKEYNWMLRWPFRGLLLFCSRHMRNFIWEQQFAFQKIGEMK